MSVIAADQYQQIISIQSIFDLDEFKQTLNSAERLNLAKKNNKVRF